MAIMNRRCIKHDIRFHGFPDIFPVGIPLGNNQVLIIIKFGIISMPLTHELPEKLVHGKNIHFVKDVAEIEDAVAVLIKDQDYRMKLMREARAYHYRHVSPEKVIERVVGME